MSAPQEGGDDDGQRNRANIAAAIAVVLLAAGAIWLLKTISEHQRIEDCLASGRHDCVGRIEPPPGPPATP